MAAYRQVDDLQSPASWLPVHRDQLQAQCSVSSMGRLYHLHNFQQNIQSSFYDIKVTVELENFSFQYVNAHWLLNKLSVASVKGLRVNGPQEMKPWKFNACNMHQFPTLRCGFVLQWFHCEPDPQRFPELMPLRFELMMQCLFLVNGDMLLVTKENRTLL